MHPLRYFKKSKELISQRESVDLADTCSFCQTYLLTIPCSATLGALSEVNHYKVLWHTTFSLHSYNSFRRWSWAHSQRITWQLRGKFLQWITPYLPFHRSFKRTFYIVLSESHYFLSKNIFENASLKSL